MENANATRRPIRNQGYLTKIEMDGSYSCFPSANAPERRDYQAATLTMQEPSLAAVAVKEEAVSYRSRLGTEAGVERKFR